MKIFNILSEEAINRKIAKIKLSVLSDQFLFCFIFKDKKDIFEGMVEVFYCF